jgi:hypothetical protein
MLKQIEEIYNQLMLKMEYRPFNVKNNPDGNFNFIHQEDVSEAFIKIEQIIKAALNANLTIKELNITNPPISEIIIDGGLVIAPSLEELKNRSCSLEELQVTLCQIIEKINSINYRLGQKEDRKWRATL